MLLAYPRASWPAPSAQGPCPVPCPVPQVGWPHKNVMRELLREPAGVSLVLKKVPVPKTPPQVPVPQPCPQTAFRPPSSSALSPVLVVPQTPPQALGSPQLPIPSLALTPQSPR